MKLKVRRFSVAVMALVGVLVWLIINPESYDKVFTRVENTGAEDGISYSGETGDEARSGIGEDFSNVDSDRYLGNRDIHDSKVDKQNKTALTVLEELEVKGRAPKTGYSREQFYNGWPSIDGCSLRQRIIKRELGESAVLDGCNVIAGEYDEPYTGKHLVFTERKEISNIQIDHVVALSDAWQKGAQYMSEETRYSIATDPLNLLAVDGSANKQKSDGDAATWLPSNKKFRCQYVARQVSVKYKYSLWVTEAEKAAIIKVLEKCPTELVVGV